MVFVRYVHSMHMHSVFGDVRMLSAWTFQNITIYNESLSFFLRFFTLVKHTDLKKCYKYSNIEMDRQIMSPWLGRPINLLFRATTLFRKVNLSDRIIR